MKTVKDEFLNLGKLVETVGWFHLEINEKDRYRLHHSTVIHIMGFVDNYRQK